MSAGVDLLTRQSTKSPQAFGVKALRCCRPSSSGSGGEEQGPYAVFDDVLNGAGCSMRPCPRLTHLPCNDHRVERSVSHASILMAMHGVRALLAEDHSCELGDEPSGVGSWAPPHCGGGALLGGPQRAQLAHAWNATRDPRTIFALLTGAKGNALMKLAKLASPSMGVNHAVQLSCTLNL